MAASAPIKRKLAQIAILTMFVELVALTAAVSAAGAGHGTYVVANLLFPFAMATASFAIYITAPCVALAVLQFPIYGALYGWAVAQGMPGRMLILIATLHAVGIAAFVVLSGQRFT